MMFDWLRVGQSRAPDLVSYFLRSVEAGGLLDPAALVRTPPSRNISWVDLARLKCHPFRTEAVARRFDHLAGLP